MQNRIPIYSSLQSFQIQIYIHYFIYQLNTNLIRICLLYNTIKINLIYRFSTTDDRKPYNICGHPSNLCHPCSMHHTIFTTHPAVPRLVRPVLREFPALLYPVFPDRWRQFARRSRCHDAPVSCGSRG